MSKEGLELAALYSYNCRKAKKLRINKLLLEFAKTKKGLDRDKVIQGLEKLISYKWYEIIASHNEIEDPFDERAVRAYWTGNELTKTIEKKGSFLFPFHNFTVLQYIHNGKPDLDSINGCRISIGRVKCLKGDVLFVYHRPIIEKNNKFALAKESEIEEIEKGFIKKAVEKDWVTFHYGIGREVLREEEAISLYRRTEEAIELFNKGSK